MTKTLRGALIIAKRKARGDVYGFTEHLFTAVEYRKTLPLAWQREVEEAIVKIYHSL